MSSQASPFPPERQDKASAYDYELPEDLIASHPAPERDASRLLVVPPSPQTSLQHCVFRDLPTHLRPGDVLVLNESRVIPARLLGHREPGGGSCEVLLLKPLPPDGGQARWSALARPGKKLRPGTRVRFSEGLEGEIEATRDNGEKVVRFSCLGSFHDALEVCGNMPLPPYIVSKRGTAKTTIEDRERYQTVYAHTEGSAAAPTAGLHFTKDLLARIHEMGVDVLHITLHVGAGTFQPISTEYVQDHRMHTESFHLSEEVATRINGAKAEDRRIIAVGTTTVRTLETAAASGGKVRGGEGESSLLITPGYRFQVVDGLVTNFHLPRSTLLCLVSALIGRERLLDVYAEAVARRYRFYSYGDAMFVWNKGAS